MNNTPATTPTATTPTATTAVAASAVTTTEVDANGNPIPTSPTVDANGNPIPVASPAPAVDPVALQAAVSAEVANQLPAAIAAAMQGQGRAQYPHKKRIEASQVALDSSDSSGM